MMNLVFRYPSKGKKNLFSKINVVVRDSVVILMHGTQLNQELKVVDCERKMGMYQSSYINAF